MGKLDGKAIVITGSSRGFGLAIARACGREGARVLVSSRGAEPSQQAVSTLAAEGITASGRECDVADAAQVQSLLAHALTTFGRVDVWVNNAGYAAPYGPLVDVPPDRVQQTIDTNVIGVYNGSRVALRYFLKNKRGKLINILGRGSDGEASPMQASYAASKSWVRSFTRSLAKEHGRSGVGIYAFNPGMMSTDFLTRLEAVQGFEGRLRVMPTIIRMWANPPELPAERVVYLASQATDGKTGLELRQTGRLDLVSGVLGEALRRIMRQPAAGPEVEVVTIPPAGER